VQSDSATCHALCVPHKDAPACYAVDAGVIQQNELLMKNPKLTIKTSTTPSFWILFCVSIVILLMFNPDTNGNNLVNFSNTKLIGFLFAILLNISIMVTPLFWKTWRSNIGIFYGFVFLMFITVDLLYFAKCLSQLLN
jgi:hypothetical protein